MTTERKEKTIPKAMRQYYDQGFHDGLAAARNGAVSVDQKHGKPSVTEGLLLAILGSGVANIRITPEDAGRVHHCKASIQTVAWPKHYVYYRADHYEPPRAFLAGFLDKIDKFWSGELKPSPDRWSS